MFETTTKYHRLRVTEDRGVRLLRLDRSPQSSMKVDDPFDTDFEYPQYLHLALALNPTASRTLVIGLGGGTIVKQMWSAYPDMRIDAVEIDLAVVDVARRYFELPDDDRVRVFVGDGREFVERSAETYDIVVLDAYDDDRIPYHLTTREFFESVRSRMTPEGVAAYNVIGSLEGDWSKPFRSLHRTMGMVWPRVVVFAVGVGSDHRRGEIRNIVLLGTDSTVDDRQLLANIESRVNGRVALPGFEGLGRDHYTGGIRGGDVPVLEDRRRDKRRPWGHR
jgi:spermidine synthase